MKKKLTLVVSLLLVMALSIGGTLAYLTYTTEAIENTFTVGNVKIKLEETGATKAEGDTIFKNSYKMIPGQPIKKDPTVTVLKGSEACWLFVKIEESASLDTYISYTVADGWTELEKDSGIYWRKVAELTADAAEDVKYSVLKEDKVTVNSSVTQEDMDNLGKQGAVQPTLTFTAYAIQQQSFTSAADAWAELNPPAEEPTEAPTEAPTAE